MKWIRRASFAAVAGNLLLALAKFWAGALGGSDALRSDAFHSLSDVLVSLTALWGARRARRERDATHPFGYERFESLSLLFLGMILALTGLGVGVSSLKALFLVTPGEAPALIAAAAALFSVLFKELLFRYARKCARKADSPALNADAWHHRSDALCSLASLAGIAGARLGLPLLDPLFGALIALPIVRMALGFLRSALAALCDHAADAKRAETLRAFLMKEPLVLSAEAPRTRMCASGFAASVVLHLDPATPLSAAAKLTEELAGAAQKRFPDLRELTLLPLPEEKER